MKIVTYNIQFGRGQDRVFDLERICDEVAGADIMCLQEIDVGWGRSGDVNQAIQIANYLENYYWVFGPSFDMDASYKDETGKIQNKRRQHGVMILSRWPIISSRTFPFPKAHYPDRYNMQMGFVEGVIAIGGQGDQELRVYNVHLGHLTTEERLLQIDTLLAVYTNAPMQRGAWSGIPTINDDDWSNNNAEPPMPKNALAMGDFNSPLDSEEYNTILKHSDLIDAWRACGNQGNNSRTLTLTQSDDIPASGHIDHVFVSPELATRISNGRIDTTALGSDHLPVWYDVDW